MLNDSARWFPALIAGAAGPPLKTAVIHPVDAPSLGAAVRAAEAGLIDPVLVGPSHKVDSAAEALGVQLERFECVDAPHSHAAAAAACQLAREGGVAALMKGALHTGEVMGAAVPAEAGLRTERRMSHIFAMDAPDYPKPLFITDAAVNIEPDLAAKRDIVQNAIDLASAFTAGPPKVAILSATEEVDPKIRSTIEAAALCKMADRKQISGGLLDGPLAFDLAVSKAAVEAKGVVSNVAGDADILVVPNLEAGNMTAKMLDYLGGASAAGIVLGAKLPIILTSRSDSVDERLASCALAKRYMAGR